ncbi:MAG: 2OG-Fe dioxygenase family protein [Candidatus Eremiobacteraeota bacterium]|nr:2OG-Fe dioxygenase family protein [Candidatus Eremiobacteraeota bacterium]MCW5868862.1 2OG-Fe dioxygenase family protein [Candidatus Eremiobacteraeota bacterium]
MLVEGWRAVPAAQWAVPQVSGEDQLVASWGDLIQDRHMADGGCYRFRRYSRLLWRDGSLSDLSGNSIYQELVDNPLNGGVERTFAPLLPEILANPFLRAVIQEDARVLHLRGDWQVGIHCVRILARPSRPGLPTPEGVHRDAETYTVQHLIARRHIRGGVFTGYDEEKRPVFHWLQLQRWDTLYFQGKLWHSATPIESDSDGYRDILLIDFVPLQDPAG